MITTFGHIRKADGYFMQTETLPSGTVLYGRYRIERALGSGGFGHVYLSVDLQSKAQYAIKEYLVTGASGKAQLEHEAQVLSHLHHPNLPALLAAFDEGGRYYVVINYIEGNDLTDYIRVVRQKNEVVPIARLMEWLLSICDAVAFLHSQHPPIIHRDIKPDNIRITPSGTAILVDLGNAKTAADGARTLFFIRHQGTPGYAPLEQYPGGTGTDERSDIYALGGTLYFALTAHEPPSVSSRNQALQQKQPDLPSLQDRLMQNPPDIPAEARQFRLGVSKPARPAPRHSRHLAQLGTLPPELLRKLDAIIQRAMAMRPKDRYQTVTDLSSDLKKVLQALPPSTLPSTGNNRPVDPHSTQPDLPMLYEAMQNAQTSQQSTSAQPNPAPSQSVSPSPQTPAVPGAGARCPRCGMELTRLAPFCPHCGNPLNKPSRAQADQAEAGSPQTRGKGSSRPPIVRDISEVTTVVISPRTPAQDSTKQSQHTTLPATQLNQQTSAHHTPSTMTQQQTPAPSQPVPAVQAQSVPPKMPSKTKPTGTHGNVKPFMPSASLNTTSGQAPSPKTLAPPLPPTISADTDKMIPKKFVISLAIAIVTLIIVMLLLMAFLHNQHGPASGTQLHSTWLKMAIRRVLR